MFVAPLSLPVSNSPERRSSRPSSPPRPGRLERRRTGGSAARIDFRPLLLGWFLLGMAALLLVPDVRVGLRFGATLPFWLVAAPAIDLAWLMRARLAAALRSGWTSRAASRARCQARRAPPDHSALRARLDRSSRK